MLGRPVNTDLGHGLVVVTPLDRPLESRGDARAQGQFGDASHAFPRGDGHDAGDDRNLDGSEFTTLAKIIEVMVVKEELSADVIRPRVDFPFEVIHFLQPVGRSRVSLGKPGDADTETAGIGGVRA